MSGGPDDDANGWQILASEKVYETPWMRVHRDEVVTPGGKKLTYSFVTLTHRSAYIVAVNDKGEVLLQRNFRYPIKRYTWGIPAGHSDEGEDTFTAAKRELLEEAGLESDDWTNLGNLYQATGVGDISGDAFLARNVRSVTDERDEAEDITEQKFLTQSALEDFIRTGKIDEGVVIAALYLARLRMNQKEE